MKGGLFFLLLLLGGIASDAAEARRYRLTLQFSDPAFRWSQKITYRDEFHLILDNAPLGDGYWGWVAGVIYPKNGELFVSLTMCKLRGKDELSGAWLAEVRHVKLPPNRSVDIPIATKDFKTCKATFTPVK